ncbi:cytoskeletal protein binding protein [Tulasnella sp. UAMH 9824]|nr:cytoskeletal protein binding protein [Tulasnella sp. UAMH 9824]
MNWGTIHETSRPIDILDVKHGFEATTANELTAKEGDFLFILSAGARDGWVRARPFASVYEDPSKEPSGWVPRSCLTKLPAEYRGCALYEYSAASENCIATMHLGQRMDIYARMADWLLVKLDGSDGKVGGTGYVPSQYVEILDEDDAEISQPPALKALPREVPVQPWLPNRFFTPTTLSASDVAFQMAIDFISAVTVPIIEKPYSCIKSPMEKIIFSPVEHRWTIYGLVTTAVNPLKVSDVFELASSLEY